jgi:hypothetical protein
MKNSAGLLLLLLIGSTLFAQEKKSVEVLPITTPLTIDGILDEPVYSQGKPAKDFVQLQPYNGKPSFQPSEVHFFYDQTAIYVGAMLYDSHPDSIFNYLTERDNIGMADYFGVYIDPYNQGQLAYGFFISPAGVQVDIKATKTSDGDNEDSNWNAVWQSKTRITDKGWVVEMRIPYSALRFSEKSGNSWGMNMFRNIRRYNSNSSWNFIDRKVSGFIHQEGVMTGIKDIKPPVRLSFSPYLASYIEKDKGAGADFLYKAGLDLKYGINESFTLDMMVIPDFGQIQSDDKQLNLSPYEIYYSEKRQFFTEGTELFQRGGIFYSRRIGAAPKFSADNSVENNEVISYNPNETQLVNATKISGRTKDGWGLGILNAMSLPSYAGLTDTVSGNKHNVLVQPFTNYNLVVVDKSLKNNSYISLINSNVSMVGNPFRANVTATEFELRDRTKTYAIKGKGGISSRGDSIYDTGFYGYLGVQKNKGNLQYGTSQNLYSDKYNPNDLGYLQRNNQLTTETYIYDQIIEPFWIIRECNGNIWWDYIRMYNPNTLYGNQIGYNANVTFKNNYSFNSNGGYSTDIHDYFEPRVTGRYYLNPHNYWYNLNLNTDSRKNLNFYFHYGHSKHLTTDEFANYGDLEGNLRIGQRYQIDYLFSFNNTINGVGYVDEVATDIIFAKRNVNTIQNVITTSYVLNNKSSFSLRIRHYWSGANNKSYYLLQPDGSMLIDPSYTENQNQNYNAFTVDMLFRWNFAPGSEMVIAWKNAAYACQSDIIGNYWDNLHNTWLNQSNSISLKVLYYIDYNNLNKRPHSTKGI